MDGRIKKGVMGIFMAGSALALGFNMASEDQRGKEPMAAEQVMTPLTADQLRARAESEELVAANPPDFQRGLSPNERWLARQFFGQTIDLENVRILGYSQYPLALSTDRFKENNVRYVIIGRIEDGLAADFTAGENRLISHLMKHLTQVWQNQNNAAGTNLSYTAPGYNIGEITNFSELGRSAQQQMIGDYAGRFLHPDRKSFMMECHSDMRMAGIVEGRFPALRVLRAARTPTTVLPLTRQERAFVYAIFGDQVDSSIMHKRYSPLSCGTVAASVNNDTNITFWHEDNHSVNYATESDSYKFGLFIHEATHNWQNQTDRVFSAHSSDPHDEDKYTYEIDLNAKVFTDYEVEQQAAIIEDYARTFLHPAGMARTEYARENADALRILVENQFPQARESRLYFEENRRLPDLPPERNLVQRLQETLGFS